MPVFTVAFSICGVCHQVAMLFQRSVSSQWIHGGGVLHWFSGSEPLSLNSGSTCAICPAHFLLCQCCILSYLTLRFESYFTEPWKTFFVMKTPHIANLIWLKLGRFWAAFKVQGARLFHSARAQFILRWFILRWFWVEKYAFLVIF